MIEPQHGSRIFFASATKEFGAAEVGASAFACRDQGSYISFGSCADCVHTRSLALIFPCSMSVFLGRSVVGLAAEFSLMYVRGFAWAGRGGKGRV